MGLEPTIPSTTSALLYQLSYEALGCWEVDFWSLGLRGIRKLSATFAK